MNVTVKPLEWVGTGGSRALNAKSSFGEISVFPTVRGTWSFVACMWFSQREFGTAEEAKMEAERLHIQKVLGCLEPANKDTCAEFVTLYAQCRGEYD
jgi:hypothetical protein